MKCKSGQRSYYVDEIANCPQLESYVSLGLLCIPSEKAREVARLDSVIDSAKKVMDFVGELCLSHEWEAKDGESAIDKYLRLQLGKRRKQLEKRVDGLIVHYERLLGSSGAVQCTVRNNGYHIGQILDKIPENAEEVEFLKELERT